MNNDDYRKITMQRSEPPLRIELPDAIGYVEITTHLVNGPTGYPTVGVHAYSTTERSPAADGRMYKPVYSSRKDEIVLVGEPGPKMLEQERQVKWVEKVFMLHNSGDHTKCPTNCPAKEN